jgi:ABC-2 type transport system permease protein
MKNIEAKKVPNQFRAYVSLVKGSLLGAMRNPTTLFFNFFFPLIFISIFGVLGFGSTSFDVAVTHNSLKSGVVYETLTKIEALNLITNKSDKEIQDALYKGQIPISIEIQENGYIEFAPTRTYPKYLITINKSAADPSGANTVSAILNSVIDSINLSGTEKANLLVSREENLVEGRKYEQIDFILPGQLAFALLMNALFGISFTFISFRKELILKRYFASPVKKSTILASEVTSKAIIAILQSLLIILVGYFVFKFTLTDGLITVLNMLALSIIGIFTFLSLGLLIPSITKSEDAIAPIAQLIMMPQLFLSGAFFPVEAFPAFLQPLAKIMPMTFLNEAFKKVAFEGVSLIDVLPNIGALLLWGIAIYIVDIFLFKWE